MKLIISESQYNTLISENKPLDKETYNERLQMAKELAKEYPNPRQFELKHKELWNFIRHNKLVDDVFPNRKKYVEHTRESAFKIASSYKTPTELELYQPNVYQYLLRHGYINDVYPKTKEGDTNLLTYKTAMKSGDNPNDNPEIQRIIDNIIQKASSYRDMDDIKERNPELYTKLSDFGHGMDLDTEM